MPSPHVPENVHQTLLESLEEAVVQEGVESYYQQPLSRNYPGEVEGAGEAQVQLLEDGCSAERDDQCFERGLLGVFSLQDEELQPDFDS